MKASYVPCTQTPPFSPANMQCPAGVPAGTVIEVFPTGGCQVEWILGVEYARESVMQNPFPARWLFAAYRTTEPVYGHDEGDRYVVIFGAGEPFPPPLRVYLDVSDGRIVQTDSACGLPLASIERTGMSLLTPVPAPTHLVVPTGTTSPRTTTPVSTPVLVPTLTPTPRPTSIVLDPAVTPAGFYSRDTRTGIPVVDRILDAVMNNDSGALASLVTTQQRPCTRSPRALTDDVRCPPGVPEPTLVEVFPTGACNLGWIFGRDEARASTGHFATMLLWPYAVARLTDASFATSSGAGYVIVLGQGLTSPTVARIWVDARDGTIVQIGGSCGTIGNTAAFGGTFILPPLP